ncbi:GAF domain-containing protein [Thalassotalea piscium]
MNKVPFSLSEKTLLEEIHSLQIKSSLEQGRNEVLRMAAQGEKLSVILNTLCEKAQLYNNEMYCSVLQLNNDTNTLHSIASASLPKFFCDAIDGLTIGASVGSCGTAAYKKTRVIVENIDIHPYWAQYKELALFAGLQACWSEPIIGSKGRVFGTFAMYYKEPKTPTADDLHFIEVSANLAAVVFENYDNRQQLLTANQQLSHTVDQRTLALEKANKVLEEIVKQQNNDHLKQITNEKRQTTKSLVEGFANRVNSPISIALTAIGTAEQQIQKLQNAANENKLTRTEMSTMTNVIVESISLSHEKLILTTGLLEKFNNLVNIESRPKNTFEMSKFFKELQKSLVKLIGQHKIQFETDQISVTCNKDALWQVFHLLIENSIIHGFPNKTHGNIFISATMENNQTVISYQDDGQGIAKSVQSKIFEPFFSTKADKGYSGLGLSTIEGLLKNVLSGEIKLLHSPIGTRFQLTLNNSPSDITMYN